MAGEDLRVGDDGRTRLGDLHRLEHAGGGGWFTEEDGELGKLSIVGIVARRQANGGLLAETAGGGIVRAPMSGERDLEDALTVLLDTDVLGFRCGIGSGDDGGQVFLGATAGEGHRGVEGKVDVGHGLHLGAPSGDRLVFDGNTGGVADPEVRVPHERPSLSEGGGGRGDVAEGFEFTAQLLFRRGVEPSDGRSGFGALVGDAVEGGLTTPTADGHVHVAVLRADDGVGHGERAPGGKDFLAGLPAAAFRRQMNRVKRGEGPIAGEERTLVSGGELGTRAHRRTRRGAWAHVDEGGLHVERRERVVAGTGAPAQLATGRAQVDARRTVPRGAHIPFHV